MRGRCPGPLDERGARRAQPTRRPGVGIIRRPIGAKPRLTTAQSRRRSCRITTALRSLHMLADAPNLFFVIGLPVLLLLLVVVVCLGIYKLLGGVLHD